MSFGTVSVLKFSQLFPVGWEKSLHHTAIELRVGKQLYEMRSISGRDMISLQVQRNVAKGNRIAIDIQCSNARKRIIASLLGARNLAEEVLRKVGRSYATRDPS